MKDTILIFYVDDIDKTKMFYKLLFETELIVDEPGMCELKLPDGSTLGIMPNKSLEKLFGTDYIIEKSRKALPNVELYIIVEDALKLHNRAVKLGATEIREFAEMDWGDKVAYSITHDGHILAFAEKVK